MFLRKYNGEYENDDFDEADDEDSEEDWEDNEE